MAWLRHYLLALQFFTRVPVTGRLAGWVGYSPALLRASAAHFPGIGLLVGLLAAGVAWVLLDRLPPGTYAPFVAAVLSTIGTVLFTGALHEDGLADVADGLGGSHERRRALEIMKDSRVGAFGAMALVLVVSAKFALLALVGSVDTKALVAALVLAHVVSRAWPLLVMRWLPYVGEADGTKAKPMADAVTGGTLLVAALWTFAVLAGVAWLQGMGFLLAALVLSALAFAWMLRLFARRLQGFTGDCLGATQQVCEIACYLGVALQL
jgi:adenosylcobinamide-GDP ribazoletransferase